MSACHFRWSLTGSTLSARIFVLRLANSGCNLAIAPSSVVQTGVKSLGCENKIAQPFPIHSWKFIVPCVVSALKLGAVSLIRRFPGVVSAVLLRTLAVLMIPPQFCSSKNGFLDHACLSDGIGNK